MNEQIKRLADEILNFATERLAFATELIDSDDIKAALRQAIKQVNQIQHREEQRRAAAQRAAIDRAAAVEVVPLPELDQYFR